jgi:CXXC-20-CXXC protein
MKYRAICPSCGYKFGRLWFFRVVPEYLHTCPGCGVRLKSESRSEWGFSALIAAPVIIAFALWRFWSVSAWLIALVAVVMLFIGVVAFPYLTKFELRNEQRNHDA